MLCPDFIDVKGLISCKNKLNNLGTLRWDRSFQCPWIFLIRIPRASMGIMYHSAQAVYKYTRGCSFSWQLRAWLELGGKVYDRPLIFEVFGKKEPLLSEVQAHTGPAHVHMQKIRSLWPKWRVGGWTKEKILKSSALIHSRKIPNDHTNSSFQLCSFQTLEQWKCKWCWAGDIAYVSCLLKWLQWGCINFCKLWN